jgi:uncharacterized protein
MDEPRPVALITGASSGLGAEFARALAAKGANLILAARREDRLLALAKQLEAAYGTRTEVLVVDLATDAGIETVRARIVATPNLHWLINNAGFNVKGYFHKAPVDTLDRMYRLQVLAPFQLTHAALVAMVTRNSGAIINVASVVSFVMTVGSVSYASTSEVLSACRACRPTAQTSWIIQRRCSIQEPEKRSQNATPPAGSKTGRLRIPKNSLIRCSHQMTSFRA